jgi:hypothetical protein
MVQWRGRWPRGPRQAHLAAMRPRLLGAVGLNLPTTTIGGARLAGGRAGDGQCLTEGMEAVSRAHREMSSVTGSKFAR